MQAHMEFYTFMQENYPEHTSERLNVPATGTSLRKSDGGEWVVTDGPFPESKEAIGGYYLFDAADLDEAISVAKRCPAYVGLELRPIYEYAG